MTKKFALTGVAGYIAPKHLQAIKETGNELIAAVDPHDSVGVMDKYFFNARYFKEFERFDRYLEKYKRLKDGNKIDYVTVCSPNYLHDSHVRFALRIGADAICEKPLVLNPWNLDALEEFAEEHKGRIYNVLQLRLHSTIKALKEKVDNAQDTGKYNIELTYITSRGNWYMNSWKGNIAKSGGIVTNIGIHFFDMLLWIFGPLEHSEVHYSDGVKSSGFLELKKAKVKWYLSIDNSDLPEDCQKNNKVTYRSIKINDEELEFSEGFTDLHTKVYKDILSGGGYGPTDTRDSIILAHTIRNSVPSGPNSYSHSFLKK